ncbi:NAD(P)(+) transhydrogenase (Re/Si-specific) subunit beta [Salinisphaera sp. Q1T1-3]|uniref:NAD(P)(+) transhydrogenase (Re/Si-specific) subunit beta n=1 Tax=Salinisphaera sp. Q1T1-3 TaxID=2321229 RepID=UPI000E745720|nr:NAD(P)(+) transhydrogenase (Re/Si-specific) subunit beta [Salinisphaera sp. Q1T1-3]RJS92879.1 NAD(P)(+) transhydrogenase (Re/Si-specific) subunit beta [Salinisphaera sp. Q1T1-3]
MSFWDFIVNASYFIAAVLFIYGLKQMGSPRTASKGIRLAGIGMLVAVVFTLCHPAIHGGFGHYLLMLIAIAIGGGAAWKSGQTVQMTAMPQMVALYNGMGGGAAAAIALIEMYSHAAFQHGFALILMAVIGALIGGVSFAGSLIAWAKLEGKLDKTLRVPGQQLINGALAVVIVILGWAIVVADDGASVLVTLFFLASLAFGVLLTIPIGGADMPVVISMYNAFTGLAVAFEGYVIDNPAMIIAGMVVGAAGSLLTWLMAVGMNRSLTNVLFAGFGADDDSQAEGPEGEMKSVEGFDAAASMAYADSLIIVPGYGLAVAQAQHKLWEFVQALQTEHGVDVKFAIHPVAGRMPGHMNVLLAEAGVPYDLIYDLEEINPEFPNADAALVIGANDVVNPAAKADEGSPIYGMPILNVDAAHEVYVVKRGKGTGFSGVQNHLFFGDNTRMVFGDAKQVCADLTAGLKQI